MIRFVGVGSQKRMGKDVTCDYIVGRLNGQYGNWEKRAFADGVKEVFTYAFGCDRAFIEEWKPREDEIPEGFNVSVRHALTWIGDGFRQIMPPVWIDCLFNNTPSDVHLAISDIRYINELDAVRKRNGINIFIWRPGFENDVDHPSEKQLRPYIEMAMKGEIIEGPVDVPNLPFDYVLFNNGTLNDLYNKIELNVIPFILSCDSSAAPIYS